ncbi:MAG: J domain-containing protein [Halobacteriales archaeon]|nr:J domain-containing protein [Halobacteriales archaeon]
MDRDEALSTLDLPPGADERAIRRAYRTRVKAVHPDAADGGDEDEFRRVRAAYEQLSGPGRGKG